EAARDRLGGVRALRGGAGRGGPDVQGGRGLAYVLRGSVAGAVRERGDAVGAAPVLVRRDLPCIAVSRGGVDDDRPVAVDQRGGEAARHQPGGLRAVRGGPDAIA